MRARRSRTDNLTTMTIFENALQSIEPAELRRALAEATLGTDVWLATVGPLLLKVSCGYSDREIDPNDHDHIHSGNVHLYRPIFLTVTISLQRVAEIVSQASADLPVWVGPPDDREEQSEADTIADIIKDTVADLEKELPDTIRDWQQRLQVALDIAQEGPDIPGCHTSVRA